MTILKQSPYPPFSVECWNCTEDIVLLWHRPGLSGSVECLHCGAIAYFDDK